YWKQYLSRSIELSQLQLKIDNTLYSVIGVMPPGFQFPQDVALWVPCDREGENPSRSSHNYDAVGRLRNGVAVEQANAEISAMARRIHDRSSDQSDYLLKDATVVPLQDSLTGKARPALLVLLGAVGFLLLVACANVANLRLAQASVRERELAIRSAIRATSGDVRKSLAEGSREQAGSQASQKIGQAIVAAQIAITLVLVIGTGLLGRSLMKLLEVNPGFRVDKIVTMDVSLPWTEWN